MGLRKRISALLLAVCLSFGVCATDYIEVQALEWAGVTIGLDTALKFLLGLVGVSVGVGVADEIDWTETREQCITFQQNQGNSAVAVSNWWADVIRGKLDTASECWESFKEWASSLINSSSTVSTNSFNYALQNMGFTSTGITNFDNFVISTRDSQNYNFDINFNGFSPFAYVPVFTSNGSLCIFFVFFDPSYNYEFDSSTNYINCLDGSRVYGFSSLVYFRNYDFTGNMTFNRYDLLNFSDTNSIRYNKMGVSSSIAQHLIYSFDDAISSEKPFEGAFEGVTDIALGSDIATDLPVPGVLDIPWENVGDSAEAVDRVIDDALEKVNTGAMTLTNYWEFVQNITNVFAYDITNDLLLPNDGNNETTEDKVQENVNRGAFVLAGLEKVFPFCIPWDIYAFVTLLVAEPVAPVIEYPIYNPVTDTEEIIIIDFSVWEQQVIIMRYIFDFLLIIGLLLLARSLIGAGGSD